MKADVAVGGGRPGKEPRVSVFFLSINTSMRKYYQPVAGYLDTCTLYVYQPIKQAQT